MASLKQCFFNKLTFVDDITKWIDKGSHVDVVYLDFQKTFDKVPHQRLLVKLRSYALGDKMVNWLGNWLEDRRQRVLVEACVSDSKPVLSGVLRD